MHLIIGLGIAVLLITAYVISTVSKLKDNSAAMEQATRELIVRLQNIEGRLDETGRGINENFVSMRKEQREESRAGREEQSRGISSFGDAQANRIKEIGDLQRGREGTCINTFQTAQQAIQIEVFQCNRLGLIQVCCRTYILF